MIELLQSVFILGGAAFCLIAAIGIVRLPDLYVRMHAATKAGTLGAGLTILAVAIGADDLGTVIRSIAAILFLLLTAPIAAHLLARAAYASGVKMWDRSGPDHLDAKYDFEAETLAGIAASDSAPVRATEQETVKHDTV
jgi:multicomponent Na+:H+ antiporter subunit G